MLTNKVTINDEETFEIPDINMEDIRDMLVRRNTTPEMCLYSKDVLDFMMNTISKVRERNHAKTIRDYIANVGINDEATAMCTVEFNMPRRSGNTELALRLLECNKDALLVVRDSQTVCLLKRRVDDKCMSSRIIEPVCTGVLIEKTGSLLITDLYHEADNVRKCAHVKSSDPNFVWFKTGRV